MKPEGRQYYNYPHKKDVHPPKGYINWWEDVSGLIPRSTRKQKLKKEIENG